MPQRIQHVAPGSIAERHGITDGDSIVRISGIPVLDLVDYQYLSVRPHLEVLLRRPDGSEYTVHIRKPAGVPLGVTLESSLMSAPKTCCNHCVFCFIEQMPPNLRESLYIRDDDWRLSLMSGNFVTLTNLPEEELQRIIERKASPLYISVHATEGDLRTKLLRHPKANRILEHLRRFSENGIRFHCQVVLCPGLNDGVHLTRTLSDLMGFMPCAESCALVPVGLTRYREHLYPLRPYTREEARSVICEAERFQREALARFGTRFVFPSDEFYLIAGLSIPPDEAYEDYPQYENGVGLLRRLYDEFDAAWRMEDRNAKSRRVAIACGTSVAPFLTEMLFSHPLPGLHPLVIPVRNRFFGETVTVSGLITGGDLTEQLSGVPVDEILITENMLRKGEAIFLDDMTLEEAKNRLGIPVTPVADDGAALLGALLGLEETV
ncbi:MAG: DUF512 domain-containing protein [Clostridiales bacterium]|nr:DUF512 domain-containing protein [Clostridiales bacterium]